MREHCRWAELSFASNVWKTRRNLPRSKFGQEKKIQKYYELAKQIPLYCIATGIFLPFFCITIPLTFFSLKYWTLDLKYFMEAGWPIDQIENSRKCVEQVWKAMYKPSCSTQPVPDNGKKNIAEQLWADISSSEVNIDFKEIYPNSNLFWIRWQLFERDNRVAKYPKYTILVEG